MRSLAFPSWSCSGPPAARPIATLGGAPDAAIDANSALTRVSAYGVSALGSPLGWRSPPTPTACVEGLTASPGPGGAGPALRRRPGLVGDPDRRSGSRGAERLLLPRRQGARARGADQRRTVPYHHPAHLRWTTAHRGSRDVRARPATSWRRARAGAGATARPRAGPTSWPRPDTDRRARPASPAPASTCPRVDAGDAGRGSHPRPDDPRRPIRQRRAARPRPRGADVLARAPIHERGTHDRRRAAPAANVDLDLVARRRPRRRGHR